MRSCDCRAMGATTRFGRLQAMATSAATNELFAPDWENPIALKTLASPGKTELSIKSAHSMRTPTTSSSKVKTTPSDRLRFPPNDHRQGRGRFTLLLLFFILAFGVVKFFCLLDQGFVVRDFRRGRPFGDIGRLAGASASNQQGGNQKTHHTGKSSHGL